MMMGMVSLSGAVELQEGKEYIVLKNPVSGAPKVVEFFSFYCLPCGVFSTNYLVSDELNKLLTPETKVIKYHVGLIGPMGVELTEAWSVAMALGVEDKVEIPLYIATQVNKSIRTENDIRQVFIEAGVSEHDYDAIKQSPLVQVLNRKQQDAVKEFGVTVTPSFYVNGRYLVRNNSIRATTEQSYAEEFADVVDTLLHWQE